MREYPARLIEALEERGFSREAMDTLSPKELIEEYAGWHMGDRGWGSDYFELCEAVSPLRANLALAEKAVAETIAAWEALPGGKNYPVREVEKWLVAEMKPAIDAARTALAAIREGRE